MTPSAVKTNNSCENFQNTVQWRKTTYQRKQESCFTSACILFFLQMLQRPTISKTQKMLITIWMLRRAKLLKLTIQYNILYNINGHRDEAPIPKTKSDKYRVLLIFLRNVQCIHTQNVQIPCVCVCVLHEILYLNLTTDNLAHLSLW